MMTYPMVQLCRVLLQDETRMAEIESDHSAKRLLDARAAEKQLRETRAASIVIDNRKLGPNRISDQYTVTVCFAPEMFYRSKMGCGPSNITEIARYTAGQITEHVKKGMMEWAVKEGIAL